MEDARALGSQTQLMDGRFKVLRHLGAGGMSEVYLAEQVSLGRKVALKVLRKEVGRTTEARERFRREAQLLSSVDHPAVVRVIDFAQSAHSTCLVMELAEGSTLESLLRQGPLEPSRAVNLLLQLAEGLAAIHERGIVHRDLKPQNVVVTPTPRGEQARILDFGIAHLLDDGANDQPGMVEGTPAYLSPEQARGTPVDTSTDTYSFAVMAFRMLSGCFPFPGPQPRDYLLQHLSTPPLPLDQVAPGLSSLPELTALVMRCLEKDPSLRPASGQALLAALRELPGTFPGAVVSLTTSGSLARPSTPTMRMGLADPVPAPGFRRARRPPTQPLGLGRTAREAVGALTRIHQRLSRRSRRGLWALVALAALLPFGARLIPRSVAERATTLLERGRPEEALPLLESSLAREATAAPGLLALRAVALHQLRRHLDERTALEAGGRPLAQTAGAMLLTALAEDFARNEDSPSVRSVLAQVPQAALKEVFEELATGAPSARQWGALRYLDSALVSSRLSKVSLYARSLQSLDCDVRAMAARRLAELGDGDAIPALRALSETPKDEWRLDGRSCGQDEAAEAIRALKKLAALGAR